MIVEYSRTFVRNYRRRIPTKSKLEFRYFERLHTFFTNRSSSVLKDHKLIGKKHNFRSFSITGDMRVIYLEESSDRVTFVDIGTHNQIY